MFDRNPQTFVDIYHAKGTDYQSATHKVFRSASLPSFLTLPVRDQEHGSDRSSAPRAPTPGTGQLSLSNSVG
ncbi:MAG: hypothetical protein AUH43_02110 [Acidobacteria bacterium 13_1_40CM_65_14]|nr:MAG: hypothetical protein AUH43_02110 [Acidobacteria bacterium 13_1_40CM_65_14]